MVEVLRDQQPVAVAVEEAPRLSGGRALAGERVVLRRLEVAFQAGPERFDPFLDNTAQKHRAVFLELIDRCRIRSPGRRLRRVERRRRTPPVDRGLVEAAGLQCRRTRHGPSFRLLATLPGGIIACPERHPVHRIARVRAVRWPARRRSTSRLLLRESGMDERATARGCARMMHYWKGSESTSCRAHVTRGRFVGEHDLGSLRGRLAQALEVDPSVRLAWLHAVFI